MPRTLRLLAAILSPSIVGVFGSTGQTVCATSQLDWYTDVVGETPCATYQRLRQICNSDYQVGTFNANTPGDICNDQLSTCCCNSISFALSMLCMNCQYDTPTSPNGIDAAKGTYGLYLQTCGPVFNQTLASDIQAAVCNQKIKIENDLYSLFWDLGDWYYIYTKETMQETFASTNNNSFTHCASTTVNDTQSGSPPPSSSTQSANLSSSTRSATTQSSSSSNPSDSTQSTITSGSSSTSITMSTNTPTPSPTPLKSTAAVTASKSNVGPTVGGIVGGVLALAAIGLVLFFLLRKRLQNSSKESYDQDEDASWPFQEPPRGTSSIAGSVIMGSSHGSRNYNDAQHEESPEHLLPRSPPVPGSPITDRSHGSDAYGQRVMSSLSPVRGYEETWRHRHEDGGPVAPSLYHSSSGSLPPEYRSNSGSLPPEYRSEWQPSAAQAAVPNEITQPEEGSSSEFGGSSGSAVGSDMGLVSRSRQRSQYPADVKRPLPEPS